MKEQNKKYRTKCKYCGYDTFVNWRGVDICVKCKRDWYGNYPIVNYNKR
jgi:hypothetical protein